MPVDRRFNPFDHELIFPPEREFDLIIPAYLFYNFSIRCLKYFLPGHTQIGEKIAPVFNTLEPEFFNQIGIYIFQHSPAICYGSFPAFLRGFDTTENDLLPPDPAI